MELSWLSEIGSSLNKDKAFNFIPTKDQWIFSSAYGGCLTYSRISASTEDSTSDPQIVTVR
jgi:hypothetical protein